MPNPTRADRDRAAQAGFWFALLTCIAFCAEGLSVAACLIVGAALPHLLAWVALAAVALVAGGVGAVLLDWFVLQRLRHALTEATQRQADGVAGQDALVQLAAHAEQQRRLRHDLRGALSPALLTADRLISNADPAVRRAGDILVKSIDRAASLLADPEPASPPADP